MINRSTLDWLQQGADPSVRYRVLRELLDRADDDPEVVSALAEVPGSGWAQSILALQLPDGQWTSPGTESSALYRPKYIASNWRLLVLSDLGLTRSTPGVAKGAELLLEREGGPTGGIGGSSSEVCFTGNCVRMFRRFGYGEDPRIRSALDWLVRTQKADGGWHCDPEAATGTLDCWEALAAFATIPSGERSPAVQRSIERGAEFYLEHRLDREGDVPYAPWLRTHYPLHYYYDVLVGLDVLTRLGYGRDARLGPALEWLVSRQNADGTWNLDALHPDLPAEDPYQIEPPYYPFALEYPGRPSRWITLTALTVLRRCGRV